MRKYALFAACAASIALAACSMPPYNEKLSLAQVTMSKLGAAVTEIGPVYANLDPSADQDKFYFLPERDDPVNGGGFLVAEASYGLRVWYLAGYSSYSSLGTSWSTNLENSSGTANNFLIQPIKSGAASTYDLSLLRYTPSSAYASNDLRVIQTLDPYSSFTEPSIGLLSMQLTGFGTDPSICAGSGMYAMNDIGYDLQYFLGYSPGGFDGPRYFEIESRTDKTTGVVNLTEISPPADFVLSPPLPSDLRNVFYGHDRNGGKSYLSYPTGSGYRSYSWISLSAPYGLTELTGIAGRIDAVLTNGQLLSFSEGICTVYDSAGKKQFDFPMGSLKFCYEQFVNDPVTPHFELFFSLAYWLWGREEKSDQLYVEVYSIPTDSLSRLK